jgi:hypothetical protein
MDTGQCEGVKGLQFSGWKKEKSYAAPIELIPPGLGYVFKGM